MTCPPLRPGAGWVELMRLDPGVRVGLHRHTGEVHALNLAGERRLNDGRVLRAGDYVYEPAGNVGAAVRTQVRRAACLHRVKLCLVLANV